MWQLGPRQGWSDWEDLGPVVASDPVVFQNRDGRLEVFAIGPEGALGHMWHTQADGAAGWSSWEDLGPVGLVSRLAVGQNGTSSADTVGGVTVEQRSQRGARSARELSADVLVIGAGPAGITVADGLVRAGARVVLAESGGLDDDPAAQELNNGVAYGPISTTRRTCGGRRR
jgi:hypothetical protein